MQRLELDITSETQTQRLGQLLAGCLPAGATICLIGTLGAGKTRLVQAVAEACGIARDRVVSPTFTLCNEYAGTPRINHLDLYRVADQDELTELGLEEYFSAEDLTFIEWADRFVESMPPERCDVRLDVTGPSSRHVTLVAYGRSYAAALDCLESRWRWPA
jgi:tRNA threonylcarbamoyladenosine biosynthesis protein TsaE